MTAPDDEWPIHPDNEWPVRPDPEAEKALYVPPAEADNPAEYPKTQRDWMHTIKVYSVFAGIATLVFGFVFITDMFAGDEVGVIVSYLFTLAIGLLYIFIEEDHYVGPDYSKKLREAKPRRALISDDQQPIIDMSTHEDRHDTDDGTWPVLQRNEPKPKFELYEPDKQSEQYWPHSPLSEESTVYEKVRRVSWITGICLVALADLGAYQVRKSRRARTPRSPTHRSDHLRVLLHHRLQRTIVRRRRSLTTT